MKIEPFLNIQCRMFANIYSFFVILAITHLCFSFVPLHTFKVGSYFKLSLKKVPAPFPDTIPWVTPKYSREQLEVWWTMRKDLFTIGPGPIRQSHCNHLVTLTHGCGIVRVKTSTDKVNPIEMARELLDNPVVKGKVQVLEVRNRAVMFAIADLDDAIED